MAKWTGAWPPLAGIVSGLAVISGVSAKAYYGQDQADTAELVVIANRLRHVTVAYAAKGPVLNSCQVRTGSDARVIDQMMCSIVANCLISDWSGASRMTRCVNARVDALETGVRKPVDAQAASIFPDEWLAQDFEPVRPAAGKLAVAHLAAVKPGSWVFTELTIGSTKAGPSRPSLLRWRKCIRPELAADGLAILLEPPPYTSGLRLSLPAACRDWKIKLSGDAFSGAMACRTSSGASSTGTLKGEISDDQIVFRRQRTWKKPGAWTQASFDTSAKREGECGNATKAQAGVDTG